jgi:hypothetical protein
VGKEMREIKFKGKRLDNDEWVHGFLSYNGVGEAWIRFWLENPASKDFGKIHSEEVDIETVGQFTGLTDKNGKEIYEGDIVGFHGNVGVVTFCNRTASFYYEIPRDKSSSMHLGASNLGEVIGNIHDNPDLLK